MLLICWVVLVEPTVRKLNLRKQPFHLQHEENWKAGREAAKNGTLSSASLTIITSSSQEFSHPGTYTLKMTFLTIQTMFISKTNKIEKKVKKFNFQYFTNLLAHIVLSTQRGHMPWIHPTFHNPALLQRSASSSSCLRRIPWKRIFSVQFPTL